MTTADSLHIVCPHCHKTNRVTQAQRAQAPDCGSCHQPLLHGAPVALDAHSMPRQLERNHIPVLVDFWAPWCGPCRMMAPAFAQAAQLLHTRVRFAKLDTEAHPQLAAPYGIRSIPTMVLFQQGREVARISGALPATEIVRWVQAQGV